MGTIILYKQWILNIAKSGWNCLKKQIFVYYAQKKITVVKRFKRNSEKKKNFCSLEISQQRNVSKVFPGNKPYKYDFWDVKTLLTNKLNDFLLLLFLKIKEGFLRGNIDEFENFF